MTPKIASTKVASLLREAETAIRATAEERDFYAARCSELEQSAACAKLASVMHVKGINTELSLEDLTASLQKQASEGKDLEKIAAAVEMVGPNMSFASSAEGHKGEGADPFTTFILS